MIIVFDGWIVVIWSVIKWEVWRMWLGVCEGVGGWVGGFIDGRANCWKKDDYAEIPF